MNDNNLILVTDWEKVEEGNFYLSDDWKRHEDKEAIEQAKKLQSEGHLYYAYIVDAKAYAIYSVMDAGMVYVDEDCNVILHCESQVIKSGMEHAEEYQY